MRKAPKIGTRVYFKGSSVVGPCYGVVHAVYPVEVWNEDTDRPTPMVESDKAHD
jgi:hypothetical protein